MALQSQGLRTTGIGLAAPAYGIYTPATVRAALLEMVYIQDGSTGQSLGLGRPATIGVPNAPILFQEDDDSDPASVVNGHITWFTAPTAPAVYHRRVVTQGLTGFGILWTFPRGLIIPGGGALTLWNISAGQNNTISAIIDA